MPTDIPGNSSKAKTWRWLAVIFVGLLLGAVTLFIIVGTFFYNALNYSRSVQRPGVDQKAILRQELDRSIKNKEPPYVQAALCRRLASAFYGDDDLRNGDLQIEQVIALCSKRSNTAESNELLHAYQDRGWTHHCYWWRSGTGSPGDKDQEMSVKIAKEAYGPTTEMYVDKLPTLAVIYAEMGRKEEARVTLQTALTALDKTPGVRNAAWFIYCMAGRMDAAEQHYESAVQNSLKAFQLSPANSERVWSELWAGLKNDTDHKTDPEILAAKGLLSADKYVVLDNLSATLRNPANANNALPNGRCRLDDFYKTLEPPDQADESDYSQQIFELKKWLHASPKSSAARIALAQAYVDYAWYARGGGYADKVTEQGWKLFGARLQQAKDALDADSAIVKKDPKAYAVYGKIGLGQQMDKPHYLSMVDQCHRQWPWYHTIDQSAVVFLLPRWSGVPLESETFIKQRADAMGGVKGDELYAQLVSSIHESLDGPFTPQSPIQWKRVRVGFQQVFADFPSNTTMRVQYLKLCVKANQLGDMKLAFNGLKQTDGK